MGGKTCLIKSDNILLSFLLLIGGAKKQDENRGETVASVLLLEALNGEE